MLGYQGGVRVELTTEHGYKAYMTLGLNRSFADYYFSGSIDGYEKIGIESYVPTLDNSNIASSLWSNIQKIYGSGYFKDGEYCTSVYGNKLDGLMMKDVYGFWGFSIMILSMSASLTLE